MSREENGSWRYIHEKLLKTLRCIVSLIKKSMFICLYKQLSQGIDELPSINNRIEGVINSRIRAFQTSMKEFQTVKNVLQPSLCGVILLSKMNSIENTTYASYWD